MGATSSIALSLPRWSRQREGTSALTSRGHLVDVILNTDHPPTTIIFPGLAKARSLADAQGSLQELDYSS
jgi:hypothetical protein